MGKKQLSANLIYGAGQIERIASNPAGLLEQYRLVTGCSYLDYQPFTPPERVIPEDLGVTLLVNSRAGWRAFQSLMERGASISLALLPQKPLEATSPQEREQIAALISEMAQFPGFAASIATKVLHKKRPDLIPVLDNQAIFGAYMNPDWPQNPARSDSIKDQALIHKALEWIVYDLNRPENKPVWEALRSIEPARSKIQLFDSVWWMYFKNTQSALKKKMAG